MVRPAFERDCRDIRRKRQNLPSGRCILRLSFIGEKNPQKNNRTPENSDLGQYFLTCSTRVIFNNKRQTQIENLAVSYWTCTYRSPNAQSIGWVRVISASVLDWSSRFMTSGKRKIDLEHDIRLSPLSPANKNDSGDESVDKRNSGLVCSHRTLFKIHNYRIENVKCRQIFKQRMSRVLFDL